MFCSACGSPMEGDSCPKCGSALAHVGVVHPTTIGTQVLSPRTLPIQQVVTVVQAKNPGLAAILSFFFVGLGQIYNGQIGKGIVFIICYVISILLMFVVIGFITTPVLWIAGMIDAYTTADRINRAMGITA